MNLNELWSGNDYAWYPGRGKGETYRQSCYRVKIIRTYKKRLPDNERESGFAEVLYVDQDSGEVEDHTTHDVRARDIAMRWEAYEELRAHRRAQQARMEQERREERERREAIRREKEAAENARREQIISRLQIRKGIPRDAINGITSDTIYLSRVRMEKELEIVND